MQTKNALLLHARILMHLASLFITCLLITSITGSYEIFLSTQHRRTHLALVHVCMIWVRASVTKQLTSVVGVF